MILMMFMMMTVVEVMNLTLVVVVFAPPALALVASLTTNWRRRIVSAFSAARNTSEFKVLDLFIWCVNATV